MEQNTVTRQEFEKLEKKVYDIEDTMNTNFKLLTEIDKKVDLINERISSSDKIEDYKLNPLEKRVEELEESKKWTWRAIGGTFIGIIIKLAVDVSKIV